MTKTLNVTLDNDMYNMLARIKANMRYTDTAGIEKIPNWAKTIITWAETYRDRNDDACPHDNTTVLSGETNVCDDCNKRLDR